MSKQNDFDLNLVQTSWYSEAAGLEFNSTWGNVEFHEASIPHLQFNRVQCCWLYSELDDLEMRKRCVRAIARSVLSPANVPNREFDRMWDLIGVESISPRLADTICTLYNTPPVRTFNVAPEVNEGYGDIYSRLDVNQAMQEAYRAALFTNTVLLWPDLDKESISVFTPDYFRLVGSGLDVEQLWLIYSNGGERDTQYEVWTKEHRVIANFKGEVLTVEPNPIGRIPGTILKLNWSSDLYGAGITEAAEINAWGNLIALLSTNIALYQSFSIGLLLNIEIAEGTSVGPGSLIKGTNAGADPSTVPSFEFKTPSGKFMELEELRQKKVRSFVRNHGVPAHLVDEGAGTPPTGAALLVMERELTNKRIQHSYALAKAERDLADLIGKLGVDRGRALTIDETFSVEYAPVETISDPSVQLKYDMDRAASGLISPSGLAQKYGLAKNGISDADAIELINANKKLFAGG